MQHVTPRYAIFIPSIVLFTCGGYAAKKRLEQSWGRAGKGGRELVFMEGVNSQRWWKRNCNRAKPPLTVFM